MTHVDPVRARSGVEPNGLDPWVVAGASLVMFVLAWAAYFPGSFTVDSTQQWEQILAGVYQDWHPVFHTWVMGLLRHLWDTPGVVSLAQAVGLAAVFGRLSRSLALASVPRWATVAVPVAMAVVPNSWTMVIAIWKDVAFGIFVLWTFAEVLALVADRPRFMASFAGPYRLAFALLGVFTFRHNGLLVGGITLAAVLWALRRTWRIGLVVAMISVGGTLVIQGPLYRALDSWPTPALFTYTTFVHDMGAFVTEHAAEMPPEDLAFLETMLPVERWSAHDETANPDGLYYCRQATPIIFPPEFYPRERLDRTGTLRPVSELPAVVSQNPTSNVLELEGDEFRRIWTDSALRWPGTLIRHRLCVAGVAWSPVPIGEGRPFTVPLRIAENSLGFTTQPLAPGMTPALDAYSNWWGRWSIVTWRPALWIYAGLACAAIGIVRRRRLAPPRWPGWLWIVPTFAPWISAVLFTPGQSYRYVWPAHLCAVASLTLAMRPRIGRRSGRHTSPGDPSVVGETPATGGPRETPAPSG